MKQVICQNWLESERGWGIRPDGCTIHKTKSDLTDFVKEYWEKMPSFPPEEYSRPSGEPYDVLVTDKIYQELENSKNGVVYFQGEYRSMLNKGELKKK